MRLKQAILSVTPHFALGWYHRTLAFIAALWYRFPSRNLTVIGVTGTKGKTSTVFFVAKILEAAGYRVGAISSLQIKIAVREEPNLRKMTMPGRFFMQRALREMVRAGCTHAVLEVTSEGIVQHRHRFIDFDTTVFTNIAPEHIESHGSFEKYLAAKQILFESLRNSHRVKHIKGKQVRTEKTIIVNGDDAHTDDFASFSADKKYCFHVGRHDADEELNVCEHVVAEHVVISRNGIQFDVCGTVCSSPLVGRFNVANILAALTVGISEGLLVSAMSEMVARVASLPGRMEYVRAGQPFDVVIDYAHTPESLDAVYRTLRPALDDWGKKGKLICVLGSAGGGRDRWKRPLLGAIAGAWGSEVFITNEDPYDENPMAIVREVAEGTSHARELYASHFGQDALMDFPECTPVAPHLIEDRRMAIQRALSMASPGDVVIITGKGSEQRMAIAGGKLIPWDDRAVVREELAKLKQI